MKKIPVFSIFTACLLSLCLIVPAMAAQQIEELTGKEVRNQQGQQIGTIQKVMLNPDGKIEAVTVEQGGFLGLGEEQKKISWNELQQVKDADYLVYTPDAGGKQTQTAMRQQENDQSRQDNQMKANQDQQTQQQQARAEQQNQQQQQKSGQVVVQQPGAQVKVDQSKPRVQVDQPEPKVSVTQPQPKIKVTQPPPEVTVEIKQQKPEVTVQQPQPKVDVQQQKPEVAVRQQKPEVTVKQQKPEVAVQQSKPDVQIQKSGQPEVYVEKQKQQQAQVEYEQTGQPKVDVVLEQDKQRDVQMAGQQQGRQSPAETAISPAQADAWIGRDLVDENGRKLGTVKMAYRTEDGTSIKYLLVQGDGGTLHPVPVGLVEANEAKKELSANISKQKFSNSPSISENEVQQLSRQQWSERIESHYGISPAWQDEQNRPAQEMDSGQRPQYEHPRQLQMEQSGRENSPANQQMRQ